MLANTSPASRDDSQVAQARPATTDRASAVPAPEAPQRQSAATVAACPATSLSAREVELLLEFADASERAVLEDALRCTSDPALLEAAIGWYLDRDAFDAASRWAGVADAKGLSVRPWQRMRLALHADDREQVARLLRESGVELPDGSRIEGLRHLGETGQALVLAREQAARTTDPSERERMERLVRSLGRAEAPSARVGLSALDYGPLSIGTLEASGEIPIEGWRLGFRFLGSRLDTSSSDALDLGDVDREEDISVSLARAYAGGQVAIRAGSSVRSDRSIPYGSIEFQRPLRGESLRSLGLALTLNEPSYETALCRAFCTKSRVSMGLAGGFSRADFFNLSLEAARYQTRENEKLASGFKLDSALGYVFLQELPRWDVSLRGLFQDNDLVDRLPDSLARTHSGSVAIEDILPAQYRFLGIGTSVQGGDMSAEPGRFHYAIDAHTGWQWPADEPSYGLRLSLGTSWLSWRDSLSFSLAYANALAGDADDSYTQVSLTYGCDFY